MSQTTAKSSTTILPTIFVDSHHHFYDTDTPHSRFLRSIMGDKSLAYMPADYDKDVVQPILATSNIQFVGSVHVEALQDDGVAEVKWLESLMNETNDKNKASTLKALVASCDLTRPVETVDRVLTTLQTHPLVRGIRWILDVDDNDKEYTHIATTRHDANEFGSVAGIDYLQTAEFERGLARLANCLPGGSFDLQTAPRQLTRAAEVFGKHPHVPVVIDHLGSLRYFTKKNTDDGDGNDMVVDEKQLELWKQGMQAMAKLPHAYCKLSMLGRVVPDWHKDDAPERQEILKQLLRWVVIDWFGPQRCMAALNWHMSGQVSDSEGAATTAPSAVEFIEVLSRLLPEELTLEQRNDIFANNASRFYRF